MNKLYIITYNSDAPFNKVNFHSYILSLYTAGYISDWWHHIGETYIVASSRNVNDLYGVIFPGVPQRNLLIIEVNPKNAQGWLPKQGWEWLNKYKV